jgi:hypothetical protein
MAMKKKSEIEEEISRLGKHLNETNEWLAQEILKGRMDLQVNYDRRARLSERISALKWVLNNKK